MLRGIDPLLSPELLHALASMGHGDMIAIVDANFPATALARHLVVLPGTNATQALSAVLSLLPIDDFVPAPAAVMRVVGDAHETPEAVRDFIAILAEHDVAEPVSLDRHAFYRAAEAAFAVVHTGERRLYGNILLTKGVIRA